MKKIEVTHSPNFVKAITIALFLFWIIATVVFGNIFAKNTALTLLLSAGLMAAVVLIVAFLSCAKTTVEYDTEKIRWKWLWLKYTVNYNEMDSVYYTVVSQFARYGYDRRLEIVFTVKNMELKLNDRIETEDIENCISGTSDFRLIMLYKFIESVCPEKAKGFVRA